MGDLVGDPETRRAFPGRPTPTSSLSGSEMRRELPGPLEGGLLVDASARDPLETWALLKLGTFNLVPEMRGALRKALWPW